MAAYDISVPDRQLACTPALSPEGHAYLTAMAAAANYGRANRQLLSEAARHVFESVTSLQARTAVTRRAGSQFGSRQLSLGEARVRFPRRHSPGAHRSEEGRR
jgi:hypothetical protein